MDALDYILKMEEINKSESMLINRLQSDCKEIFDKLLYEMIKIEDLKNSKIPGEILEGKEGKIVTNGVDYLIQIKKDIGFKKTKEEILNDLIETNYSLLIPKEETIDTARIMSL